MKPLIESLQIAESWTKAAVDLTDYIDRFSDQLDDDRVLASAASAIGLSRNLSLDQLRGGLESLYDVLDELIGEARGLGSTKDFWVYADRADIAGDLEKKHGVSRNLASAIGSDYRRWLEEVAGEKLP